MQGNKGVVCSNDPMIYWSNDPYSIPYWLRLDQVSKLVGGYKVVLNEEKRMWLLQKNKMGCLDFTGHEVEWRVEFLEKTEEEDWPANGSGLGRNFVSSLRRGDRIGVWARAVVILFTRIRLVL